MFAPNSIKTLMGIKNYNQLDQSQDNLNRQSSLPLDRNKQSPKKSGEEEKEFGLKQSDDLSEKVINTRLLIKEMDYKIEEIKKWKRSQRRDLEKKLAENKRELASLPNNGPVFEQQDSYDQYIQKLEEMMNLYKAELEEARRASWNQDINYDNMMNEIGDRLSEREQRIDELSEQLSIIEKQKEFNINERTLDFVGDIQTLKHSLEDRRKECNEALRNTKKNLGPVNGDVNAQEVRTDDFRGFLEKEKKEVLKEQKYNYKDDLDDIENELKELEDLLSSK